jgi:hypothetical protein
MRKVGTWLIGSGIAGLATLALMAAPASAGTPTCSDVTDLGVVVHGQHIIRDYVVGGSLDWPPNGQVGTAIAGEGVEIRGGPGPGFHFQPEHEFPPGASFCNPQAQSSNALDHQQAVP